MGFSWQEGLAIVTICGLLIVLITITKLRKIIVQAIPDFLKDSISSGMGLFIAYIGFKNASFLRFFSDIGNYNILENGSIISNSSTVPSLVEFSNPNTLLGLIGLILIVILVIKRVKGAIFISIIITIIIGIPMGIVDISKVKFFDFRSIGMIKNVAFAAFNDTSIISLFSDFNKIILTITAIFALLLSVTFDAIGAFIGAGRISGIFDTEEERNLLQKSGISSKFEKALFSDGIASAISGLFGTSNVTTYVESASGISVGGRTGLTALVVTIMFLFCLPFASLFSVVPTESTAPALIIVGVFMMGSVIRIKWTEFDQAVPAFLTISTMIFAFNISYGIAVGFIFHCLIKLVQRKIKEIHPISASVSLLFLANFIIIAFRR
jgi:AGZA family xanthine/uracil permease-like MFS transporter